MCVGDSSQPEGLPTGCGVAYNACDLLGDLSDTKGNLEWSSNFLGLLREHDLWTMQYPAQ